MTEPDLAMCLMLVLDPQRSRILLGDKLRGFGRGKVIAPGGKLEPGEEGVDAACRELLEETGIRVESADAQLVATLRFTWADGSRPFAVDVFAASRWVGEPVTSAELDPFWCSVNDIPYSRMWDDDRIWLPNVLRGQRVSAQIGYDLSGRFVERVEMVPLEVPGTVPSALT